MQIETELGDKSDSRTESIGKLAEIIAEEIAAAAGQAERERDLLLGKKLAEHELRVIQLEQMVRERLMDVRDGEKGVPGEKGEKGESIKGEKGEQGPAGEKGDSIAGPQGEPGPQGAAGLDGKDGTDGAPGRDGKDGERGERGLDGRSFTIRDTYDPNESYQLDDVVTLNSTWFVARKDAPGPCPGPDWKAGPTGRRGEKGERGDRGERGPAGAARELVAWQLDRKAYAAIPILSDGSKGAPLNLRALFEQFQAEAG